MMTSKKLIVLHIITGLSTGGAERALANLLLGGLNDRFDSFVISLQDTGTIGPQIQKLGVPVISLGFGVKSLTKPVLSLRSLINYLKPDVVQGWMYHGNLAASVGSYLAPNRPAISWSIRQSLYGIQNEKPLTRHVIRANRYLSRRADGIIYNSNISRCHHARFGFADERARVIPNGFDTNHLRPNFAGGHQVRFEMGLPSTALVIGHIARYHPVKDHAGFLRAAVMVARIMPQAHFLIAGKNVYPHSAALSEIIPADLSRRFVFTGECCHPERLMWAMDILCSSSRSEAFPNVIGEAMACGVPCVTTDVGDSADIVGRTGLIVPPGNSEALAEALLAMLRKNTAELRCLGKAARGRVKQRYALPQLVDVYTEFYNDLHINNDYAH